MLYERHSLRPFPGPGECIRMLDSALMAPAAPADAHSARPTGLAIIHAELDSMAIAVEGTD